MVMFHSYVSLPEGTVQDSTIMSSPLSTKNRTHEAHIFQQRHVFQPGGNRECLLHSGYNWQDQVIKSSVHAMAAMALDAKSVLPPKCSWAFKERNTQEITKRESCFQNVQRTSSLVNCFLLYTHCGSVCPHLVCLYLHLCCWNSHVCWLHIWPYLVMDKTCWSFQLIKKMQVKWDCHPNLILLEHRKGFATSTYRAHRAIACYHPNIVIYVTVIQSC